VVRSARIGNRPMPALESTSLLKKKGALSRGFMM
jgi:hypothetical protein